VENSTILIHCRNRHIGLTKSKTLETPFALIYFH
jgi:hypothetical protein